jgi:REP element-mobilizing transposase RayT
MFSKPAARRRKPKLAEQLALAGVSNEVVRRSAHGGRRANAGRKRAAGKRASLPHRPRPRHTGRHPVHVTLRARAGLPSLRSQVVTRELHRILARQGRRAYAARFHVVEFSIQTNHLHLIVEAVGAEGAHDALRAGVSGLVIAFAKRLNRMLHRKGKVWADRWHGRELPTPREVRNALVYVFRNVARHGARMLGDGVVDPFSSATTFGGWTRRVSRVLPTEPWQHPRPRTWLLGEGWRLHGLLDPLEARRRGS